MRVFHIGVGGSRRIAARRGAFALKTRGDFVAEIARLLDQAKTYHQAGQLRDAERSYRSGPGCRRGESGSAVPVRRNVPCVGEVDQAIAFLQQSIPPVPYDADPHHHLGVVLTEQDRLEEAITNLREAQRLRPKSTEITAPLRHAVAASHNKLGITLSQSRQVERRDRLLSPGGRRAAEFDRRSGEPGQRT